MTISQNESPAQRARETEMEKFWVQGLDGMPDVLPAGPVDLGPRDGTGEILPEHGTLCQPDDGLSRKSLNDLLFEFRPENDHRYGVQGLDEVSSVIPGSS
jgi:hypothetical protein